MWLQQVGAAVRLYSVDEILGRGDGHDVTLGPLVRLLVWSQTLPFGLVTGKLPAAFL